MIEKFHQFNRQDNEKIIKEGLKEAEPALEDSLKTHESATAKAQEEPKDFELPSKIKSKSEELLGNLDKPRDVLSLPPKLRRKGLSAIREKTVQRYLDIARLQEETLKRIEELDQNGPIDLEELKKETLRKAEELKFSPKDRERIETMFWHFSRNYNQLRGLKGLPPETLLKKLIKNRDLLPQIRGKYEVKITPFSVHFSFDDKYDFLLFTSETEGEARTAEKEGKIGFSYFVDRYPITASGRKYSSNSTFQHETQHKKFSGINIDTIRDLDSDEKKAEEATRDELLARFAALEYISPSSLYDEVLYYGFAKKYGMKEVKYNKMLRDAVQVLVRLHASYFDKEEILGLLSKEQLTTWPKIVIRLDRTNTGADFFAHGRKERHLKGLEQYKRRIVKLTEELEQKIGPILENGLSIKRRTNRKGVFLKEATKGIVVEELNKHLIFIKEKDLVIPEINTAGVYEAQIKLYDGRIIPFLIKVE
jgi:hypothetical protein